MALLFLNPKPQVNEEIYIITDECFREQRGFRVLFSNFMDFAQNDYPKLWRTPIYFFQALDMIIFAEQSKKLVLLSHEGWIARLTK